MLFGVWHVKGGFRSLARSMQRAAESLGVKFCFNTPVAHLWVDDASGKPLTKGVILEDGRRLVSDAVVINADLAAAAQKMIPNRYRRFGRISDVALNNAQYSCSTMMLYLGLDTRYDQLPHHLIYLSDAVRRTDRDSLEDRLLNDNDPAFYVCNPTVTDRAGAPDGHSTMYVLIPTPHTGRAVDWARAEEVLADRALDWLEKVGIQSIRQHVRAKRVCSAPSWRDQYAVHLGAVFNLSHTWLQLGPARPSVKSRDIDGLFWVGGGTHPGSGLLTILESANIVGDYLSRAKGLGALKRWPMIATQPLSL
jgi:phytoene desaturase